jgi:hypothetical protein
MAIHTWSPVLLVLVTACGFPRPKDVGDDATAAPDAAMTTTDASDGPPAIDAPGMLVRCDPAKPFATPTLVENVNSSSDETTLSITRDEKTGFVQRSVQAPTTSNTILEIRRASATVSFGIPDGAPTSVLNNAVGNEFAPSAVSDGLILYFHRQTMSDIGIYAAVRADAGANFDAGTLVTVDGTNLINALSPTISADGQTLYWLDFIDFGKVFSATRNFGATGFVNKRAASTIAITSPPALSHNELTMYYSKGNGVDVLMSTRTTATDMFGTGVPVANVNSSASDIPVALTDDGCVLYISSQRSGGLGGYDMWEAHRPQ